jgi:hypothetical protein
MNYYPLNLAETSIYSHSLEEENSALALIPTEKFYILIGRIYSPRFEKLIWD